MSTPKNISNKLLRDFFNGHVSYNSDQSLQKDLETGQSVNGADLLECVMCLYQSCKDEGIL